MSTVTETATSAGLPISRILERKVEEINYAGERLFSFCQEWWSHISIHKIVHKISNFIVDIPS